MKKVIAVENQVADQMMNLVLAQGPPLAAAMEAVASLGAVILIVVQNLEASLTLNRTVQNKSQLFSQSH